MEPTNPDFLNAGIAAGFVSLYPDPDGVLRRIPVLQRFNEHVYAAFSVQIAINLLNIKKIDYKDMVKKDIDHHISYFPEKEIAICKSCHMKIHKSKSKSALKPPKEDTKKFYEKKVNSLKKEKKEPKKCIGCGREISRGNKSGLCISCKEETKKDQEERLRKRSARGPRKSPFEDHKE